MSYSRHSFGASYPSTKMQSEYSIRVGCDGLVSYPWSWLGAGITILQRLSWCILQLQPTGPLVGGIWLLCKDAVRIFCSPSQLGWDGFLSYQGQWLERSVTPTPLLKCSRSILQPQLTGLRWLSIISRTMVGEKCYPHPPAEMQSIYSTAPAGYATS